MTPRVWIPDDPSQNKNKIIVGYSKQYRRVDQTMKDQHTVLSQLHTVTIIAKENITFFFPI